MNIVAHQTELRPELPNVYGTLDYRVFRETLMKIDKILISSGLEHEIATRALEEYVTNNNVDSDKFYSTHQVTMQYKKFRHALRCNIARHLTGESYR